MENQSKNLVLNLLAAINGNNMMGDCGKVLKVLNKLYPRSASGPRISI